MPKINKSFHLEITVEQFLNACSTLELQEIDLRLDTYLRKAKADVRPIANVDVRMKLPDRDEKFLL
jgi:hypothetical protein